MAEMSFGVALTFPRALRNCRRTQGPVGMWMVGGGGEKDDAWVAGRTRGGVGLGLRGNVFVG